MSSEIERDAFQDRIQGDPDICNNCFRKLFERSEKNYTIRQKGGDLYVTEIRKSIKPLITDQRYGQDVVEAPAETMTRGQTVVCECGAYHYWQTVRPVSLDDAIDMTKRLAERMCEKGISFDEDVLFDYIRREMSKPENQGTQDDVFRYAVHIAIEAAAAKPR